MFSSSAEYNQTLTSSVESTDVQQNCEAVVYCVLQHSHTMVLSIHLHRKVYSFQDLIVLSGKSQQLQVET